MLKIKDIMLKVRKSAISDDETRPQLMGVYFDESGVSISTNGHILSHSKMLFQEELKGMIINENFEVVKREFPRWQNTIPQRFEKSATVTFKKNMLKKGKRGQDRTIFFTGESFKLDQQETFEFAVDSKLLKVIIDLELTVKIEWNGQLNPIKITFDENDTNEFLIVMPIKA